MRLELAPLGISVVTIMAEVINTPFAQNQGLVNYLPISVIWQLKNLSSDPSRKDQEDQT